MKQEISALMDGELPEAEIQRIIARFQEEDGAQDAWETYHIIGDTLRRERISATRIQQQVMTRLAEEPTVLAPRRTLPQRVPFGKPVWAAAASVVFALALGWFGLRQADTGTDVVAGNASEVQGQDSATIPAANIQSYLSAHQEYSAAPAGLRPASFEPADTRE